MRRSVGGVRSAGSSFSRFLRREEPKAMAPAPRFSVVRHAALVRASSADRLDGKSLFLGENLGLDKRFRRRTSGWPVGAKAFPDTFSIKRGRRHREFGGARRILRT
jgi:hypothetical protein